MSFASLGLKEPILKGVAAAGYESPTEIQERAIPLARDGKDLVALGQTGSGKTAAYGLPILHRLVGGEPGLRALILVPTRELCVQVAENLRVYAQYAGLHVRTAFGGIPIMVQEAAIKRGLDVLVACPGRLIDLMQFNTVTLDRIETLVLDEADRMLDMGFMPQIRRILGRLPQQRQNMMFSATMPPEVERLVKDHFGGFEKVQVGARSQAALEITHRFESVTASDKEARLERLLRDREGTVLIFVKTKKRAEELGRKLQRAKLPADSIHGDKSAESRHVVLQAFSKGKARFMVATDVAARGIDVSSIGLVVNFDMPRATEDYVHRVGRTGRAGIEGEALSYVTRLDHGIQRDILRHLEKSSAGRARVVVDGKVVMAPMGEAAPPAGDRERPAQRRSGRPERERTVVRPERERRDESRRDESRRDERPARNTRPRRAALTEVTLNASPRAPGEAPDDLGFGDGVLDRAEGARPERRPRRSR